MDERLTPASAHDVARAIAREFLAGPRIMPDLGDIRLAPHQVDAVSRLVAMLEDAGGAVLADATGLGKTFVAIAVARAMGPALVVAPAALRSMWKESLRRTQVNARLATYEAMSRGASIAEHRPLLILDEAHHARNPNSRRYEALADLAWGARVLLLTATPIHNRGRDLRALLALFLGSRAHSLGDEDASQFIVRRTETGPSSNGGARLPSLDAPRWLTVPSDPRTLLAITSLPEPVATADGGVAHALLVLGLVRAWSSSEAALRATLRRRLLRATALTAALESGRLPSRRDLAAWPLLDSAVQLGFSGLLTGKDGDTDTGALRESLERHCDGVRSILRSLDENNGRADAARTALLASVRARHPATPVVAFTQFADTALAAFKANVASGGVALVTGRGARIASGSVAPDVIVHGFDVGDAARSRAMPLDLLVATDVLSEGLSLRRAGVLVHLDLPWTIARLEQRVGRLRRIGSPHVSIAVYAIGPPVEARELVTVIRALQRKARVSQSVVGATERDGALPLLGGRLLRATAALGQRGETRAREALRDLLAAWAAGRFPAAAECPVQAGTAGSVVLVSIGIHGTNRTIAIVDGHASTTTSDLLRAVAALTRCLTTNATVSAPSHAGAMAALMAARAWVGTERARSMAKSVLDAPSAVHAAVLHGLQRRMSTASRSQRATVADRLERCRMLVLSARGIGAERALERLLGEKQPEIDLEALERLLSARGRRRSGDQSGGEAAGASLLIGVTGSGNVHGLRVPGAMIDGGAA